MPVDFLGDELTRSLQSAEYWAVLNHDSTFKGRFPFMVQTPNSHELWLTDGRTELGTQRLLDIPNINSNGNRYGSSFGGFTIEDGYLLFMSRSFFATTFWRTNGTVEGTEQTGTIDGNLMPVGEVEREVGDQAYFTLETPELGRELWISDSTEAGTTLVKDFFVGPEDSAARVLATIGENAFVLANSAEGTGLWATTGTPSGTRLVKQLASAPVHTGDVIFAQHDGKLFFAVPASLRPSGPESSVERYTYEPTFDLWVTDGTEAGTTQLGNVVKSYFTDFTPFNGRLFFNGNGPDGQELWVTDGTVEGTQQVVDLAPGSSFYSPECPTQSLPSRQKKQQAQLSPALACEFNEVANSSTPRSLTVRGDFLYFVAGDRDLYRTDGTALGTQFIRRLRGENDDYSPEITALGDRLLVTGYDNNDNRPKLWAILEQEPQVLTGYP